MLFQRLLVVFSFLSMTLISFAQDNNEVCKDSDLKYVSPDALTIDYDDLRICENENKIIIADDGGENKIYRFTSENNHCVNIYIDKIFGSDTNEAHCKNNALLAYIGNILEMIKYVDFAILQERATQKNIKPLDDSWPAVPDPDEETKLDKLNRIRESLCQSLDDKKNISCESK